MDVQEQLGRHEIRSFAEQNGKSHTFNCLFCPQRQKYRESESMRVLIAPYLYDLDFISNDEAGITLPSSYSGSLSASIIEKNKSKYCQSARDFSSEHFFFFAPKSRHIKIDQNSSFTSNYTVIRKWKFDQ